MIPITLNNAALLAALLFAIDFARKSRRPRLPLPPGPPKLPLVGNLFQLPSSEDWKAYLQWSEQYDSDIIHVDAAGGSIIVLNSMEVATELLEKRSRIYSSRAPQPMVCDLMGWDWNFGFQPYGEKWRRRRRTFLEIFHEKPARQFRPQQLKATRHLLQKLLETPDNFFSHLNHHAVSVVMSTAYGIEIKPENDPYVGLATAALELLVVALMPGSYLVVRHCFLAGGSAILTDEFQDFFPWLKHVPSWFPGAQFKRTAQITKDLALGMIKKPFDDGKTLTVKYGTPSFVSAAMQKMPDVKDKQQEEVIRDAAGSMYLAGTDTTASAVMTFIFAMMTAPEAQTKAQEELDRVVPHGRLPDFEDQDSLPYVTALVKETLRWENVTPLAVPHYIEVEDEYNGYRIPANSVVMGNIWAILHDKEMYPEPHKFIPDRYIVDGKLNFDNARDPTAVAFGFGRRVCPGRHMAYSAVWLAIASILKVFRIERPADENGKVIEETYKYRPGLVTGPEYFKCSIKPRSAEAEELLSHAE
ncbi:hypothetical protein V5O48_005121 [Marasmius crinis-equi]|uniref:Cytochrome P450 n=1 Tax=Marasmius crinis-equi TaxID=585013 RepID=A0ABR3FNA5_9AGAR